MRVAVRNNSLAESAADAVSAFGLLADVLIPGRGQPLPRAALVVKDSVIDWVGLEDDLPSKYASLAFSRVPVLMPGMWDVHTHFMGSDIIAPVTNFIPTFLPGTPALIGAITVDDLRRTLMAGFTSVRELGGYAGDVWPAVEKGVVVGPNVYSSMNILGITGGHSDVQELPLSAVKDACCRGATPFHVCDGVDGCVSAVRQMVRRGARVIKICSSGGVLSLNDQPEDSQFSPAELRAIVEEAARSGRVVASHAIGKNGIMEALYAGVKTIEHGMYLDEEAVRLMNESDAILVPTRHIVEGLAAGAEDLPPKVRAKMERMLQLSRDSVKLAVKKGVKIALGTDSFSSDRNHPISHGKNAKELLHAVEAGMTPLEAIEMATATPPETLGRQGPRSGQLKAGYDADMIALSKNPVDDIEILINTDNVTHVWKGGVLYKKP